jgi:hypothetical protein
MRDGASRGHDIEAMIVSHDIRVMFPNEGIGRLIGERTATAYLQADTAERVRIQDAADAAALYANHILRRNAFTRDGDMSAWFAMEHMQIDEIAEYGRTLRNDRAAIDAASAPETDETREAEWRREAEVERIDALEDAGWYGRTLAYEPECDDWILIRFGDLPSEGVSRFGLAGEDDEDGPDQWRIETGNKTHEAGICVLRAMRHPSVPDAYIVLEPSFALALYGVTGFETYLDAIVPRLDDGSEIPVFRVDGSLKTCKGRDGTLRLDLGSDGEVMVDPAKPFEAIPVDFDLVWSGTDTSMRQLLASRRGWQPVEDEEPARRTF